MFTTSFTDGLGRTHIVALPHTKIRFTACGEYAEMPRENCVSPAETITYIRCWAREFIEAQVQLSLGKTSL